MKINENELVTSKIKSELVRIIPRSWDFSMECIGFLFVPPSWIERNLPVVSPSYTVKPLQQFPIVQFLAM